MFLFGFILHVILWASWSWVVISFPALETLYYNLSKIISYHFYLLSSSGILMIRMYMCLMLSQRSLRLS